MSNAQAIATVTAALGRIVHSAAESSGVGSVDLNFGRPSVPGDQTVRKVHIYLYQVSPNAALRNNDLPARSSDGRLTERPKVALDLHYLLAFYGNQATLEPERMMGTVIRNLQARPLLSQQAIQAAIDDHPELNDSNLADSIGLVRFTPAVISLDELSKLWSVFFQTPHAQSVAYQATVVVIESEETIQSVLPVLKRGDSDQGIDTLLGPFPYIESAYFGVPEDKILRPRPLSMPAAKLGLSVILSGRYLGGETMLLRLRHSRRDLRNSSNEELINDLLVAPDDKSAGEMKVLLPQPGSGATQEDWAPGVYTATAVEKRSGGEPERTSNGLPIALSPVIASIEPGNTIARDGGGMATITITCQPAVHPGQQAVLIVAGMEISGQIDTQNPDKVIFIIENAPTMSNEIIRLRVDGIESMPFKRVDNPPPTRFEFDSDHRITIT